MNAYADYILRGEPLHWRGRTWYVVTEAMVPEEMAGYLRRQHFPYDHETSERFSTGGTFDLTSWPADAPNGTFQTFTVASTHAGLVRLYRASDTRELREGSTW